MAGRFALLIGNSEYSDPALRKLALPEADILAVEAILTSDLCGFTVEDILPNKPWHIARPAISQFFKNRHREDFLLLYFAGHGIRPKSGNLFLAFPDTKTDNPEGTAIDDQFIAQQMDGSRAEAQLLVLDCCHAAAFGRHSRSPIGERAGIEDAFSKVINDTRGIGRYVLAATGAVQYAYEKGEVEGKPTQSLFTRFFVEGLQSVEADHDGDGQVSIQDLSDYIHDNVRAVEPTQEPELFARPNAPVGELVLALLPVVAYLDPFLDVLPDPPREGLRDRSVLARRYALLYVQQNLLGQDNLNEPLTQALEYMAQHDSDEEVRVLATTLMTSLKTKAAERARQTEVETPPSLTNKAYEAGAMGTWAEPDLAEHARWKAEDLAQQARELKDIDLEEAQLTLLELQALTFQEQVIPLERWEEREMILIPAGAFLIGSPLSDKLRSGNEPEQFKLNLDYDYAIGKYPVTVGQYRHFVNSDGYTNPAYWTPVGFKWREDRTQPRYWTDETWTGNDWLPVVGVSWYEAYAYTRWLTEATGREYRLPTEAEWEKAARGGLQIPDGRGGMTTNPNPARIWPWGNEQPTKQLCNCGGNVGHTSPVTSHAAQAERQPYGLYHMAGNVWEWCLSKWAETYQPPPVEDNDPRGDSLRVLRGGSWHSNPLLCRVSYRRGLLPDNWSGNYGFRIGRVVPVLP